MKPIHLLSPRSLMIYAGLSLLLLTTLTFSWLRRDVCSDTSTDSEVARYRNLSVETVELLHTRVGLSNGNICEMPEDKLARSVRKTEQPKPDHPDDAVAFRLLQLRDENGDIAMDGLARAMAQMERMRAIAPPSDDPAPPAAPLISPDGELEGRVIPAGQLPEQSESDDLGIGSWTWLGPGNIGGRVRSILIHPTNSSRMWAGSVGGGIWHSTNGGTTWQPVNDFLANLAVSSMAMQPNDANIMYAGTGEGFYNADSIRGAGIFKSTDGGTTWFQLPATANSDWYYVNRLAISPSSATILAATGSGIWRSTNSGTSWTQVSTDWGIKDIDFHPTNSNQAIASGSSGKAYYSTNGGQSWTQAMSLAGRVEVAYAPNNPSITYASLERNSGELWKSVNGGQSYTLANTGNNYLGGQGWYDNALWVDPTNADVVIVGGIDLWRSSNGGSSLTRISEWWRAPTSAHADHHIIVHAPGFNGTTNRTVFFGNDGGVYKTTNVYTVAAGGAPNGWQELNNTLGVTQFYGAAGNPSTGVIIGGTQDNGTLRYNGNSETWSTMFGGDGGFNAADPTNSNYFYGEYVYLNIHRSTDGGATSSYIVDGLSDAQNSCANFIAPFILDANNANVLLAGGCSLWRSSNVRATTPTWSIIKSATGSSISAIAVAAGNSDIIWVGHNDGAVYRTTNGTSSSPSWIRVDTNSPGLPNRFVTRLTIDATNANNVYATFGGFSPDNIWRTSNAGNSWADATGSGATGLPDVPVRSLVINRNNPAWIYVGTEVGVFTSQNSGTNWSIPHDGPANVSVDELLWLNNKLVAATHGRGLFATDLGIVAIDVWTGDGNWNPKSTFNPNDPIQWVIGVDNRTGTPSQVELTYDVRNPAGTQIAYWQGNVTTEPGVVGWSLPGTVPTGMGGTYIFTGYVAYQGTTTQFSTTFFVTGAQAPANNNFNSPTTISSLPYTNSQDTSGATTANDDPTFTCETFAGQGYATVWYRYTPSSNGVLSVNTFGSTYDTVLAVWTGTQGNLQLRGCDDDTGGYQSQVAVPVTANIPYYIEIAGFASDAYGTLNLSVTLESVSTSPTRPDFDGDGRADILWRNAVTGSNALYRMNGAAIVASEAINYVSDTNWKVAGVADFNGDGRADILWRNAVTGSNALYRMNGATIVANEAINYVSDTNWKIAGVADFNGDGRADILWRNAVTGSNALYRMNGATIVANEAINYVPDTNWQIVGMRGSDGTYFGDTDQPSDMPENPDSKPTYRPDAVPGDRPTDREPTLPGDPVTEGPVLLPGDAPTNEDFILPGDPTTTKDNPLPGEPATGGESPLPGEPIQDKKLAPDAPLHPAQ